MKLINNYYLPDYDTHFADLLSKRNTYQQDRLDVAFPLCKKFDVALDIGAHVGIMSRQLAKHFKLVFAFEPNPLLHECLEANAIGDNIQIYKYALGTGSGRAQLDITRANSGMTSISTAPYSTFPVPMEMLDSFKFKNVDLIKIDVEGYEKFVIAGGIETINQFKPVMIVEQEHHDKYGSTKTEAIDILIGIGYTVHKKINSDYILTFQS